MTYNVLSILSRDYSDPVSTGQELGGLIYKLHGVYFYTVTRGPEGHVNPWDTLGDVPEEARTSIVGDWHTHGGPGSIFQAESGAGETFSGSQVMTAMEQMFKNTPGLVAGADIQEGRSDLKQHAANILDPSHYTLFLGTPSGRFGVFIPAQNIEFYTSPNPALLPPGWPSGPPYVR